MAVAVGGCASSDERRADDAGDAAGAAGGADGVSAVAATGVHPREDELGFDGRTSGRGHSYPGFVPEGFATEPIAMLPATAISIPPDLEDGPEGQALRRELERLLSDRLPEEVRIIHTQAPVYAFRQWAGPDEVGPRSGYLASLLGWTGQPGAAGELPPLVGDSVEELGDRRGIRFFLFPRSLTVSRGDPFRYTATIDAYVLDARGERAVWAGRGQASGRIAEDSPESLVSGVVRDAVRGAAADLAARLPGRGRPGGIDTFSDVETGVGQEAR